jgi:hypothetical protein
MSLCRFAILSSPRSANTWLRRLLVEFLALEERAIHAPRELDWSRVPERCVLQLHWPPVPELTQLLDDHDFRVCVLVRHPLDTLISILHFAAHEPDTARWLDGAHGDERAIIGAEPCSDTFLHYATSSRARALIAITPQWWTASATARLRFEDLIRRPVHELERIAEVAREEPVISAADAVEMVSFARMQQEGDKEHFWQGRPGLWRALLPPSYARDIARPYHSHAGQFHYDLTPDPALTVEEARRNWRAVARPPATAISASASAPCR